MLLLLLADETHFEVAVVGQVLMGTVYVLIQDMVPSMLVTYARGCDATYKRLAFWQSTVYCTAMACTGAATLALYEHVGRTAPFLLLALFAAVACAALSAFYAMRMCLSPHARQLRPTAGLAATRWAGVLSGRSFAAAELLLLQRHDEDRLSDLLPKSSSSMSSAGDEPMA